MRHRIRLDIQVTTEELEIYRQFLADTGRGATGAAWVKLLIMRELGVRDPDRRPLVRGVKARAV
jgi:hypothetical protein